MSKRKMISEREEGMSLEIIRKFDIDRIKSIKGRLEWTETLKELL